MNRIQKIAIYNLIVITASLTFTAGAVTIMALWVGFPMASAGFGFFGICALTLFAPLFFKKAKRNVEYDERDIQITKNSELVAMNFSNGFFILVSITALFLFGLEGTISVITLPIMVAGAYAISGLARSVSILIQYGWGRKGDSE